MPARRIDTASALRGSAHERVTASPNGGADEKERNFAIRWFPSKKRVANGGFQDNPAWEGRNPFHALSPGRGRGLKHYFFGNRHA
jgi:hypothetical protein